ncbi:MAG: hypothetical protein NC337_02875 [Roseburia sp.]|nr:hypothetical protein [Roseburia sp.]
MTDKLIFSLYELKNKYKVKYRHEMNRVTYTFLKKEYRPTYKKYCGKPMMGAEEANLHISSLIERGEPFWVGRFGHTELGFIYSYLQGKWRKNTDLEKRFAELCNNSGFFPNDISISERYVNMILHCCGEMDVHGIWPLFMEDYFISRYEKDAKLMHYIYLEPWAVGVGENVSTVLPWSHSLKGRKVLVIHPFEETIKMQYEKNRERIFEKRYPSADDILPEFELKTLKAVQTIAGNRDERFDTWYDALDWMVGECKKTDFDVAIVGCGAYGMPLAAEIKRMGKGAIQICGATQLMFGILGGRWENNEDMKAALFNDAWVHPSEEERMDNMKAVEDACYW